MVSQLYAITSINEREDENHQPFYIIKDDDLQVWYLMWPPAGNRKVSVVCWSRRRAAVPIS